MVLDKSCSTRPIVNLAFVQHVLIHVGTELCGVGQELFNGANT